MQEKVGREEAYRLAFQESSSDALIFFTADGTEDPKDITKFRQSFEDGFDVVIANRLPGKEGNQSVLPTLRPEKWANQFFTLTANVLWGQGQRLSDSTNGFRGITRKAWLSLSLDAPGITVDYQASIRALKQKLRIKEFPTLERASASRPAVGSTISTGSYYLKLLCQEVVQVKSFPKKKIEFTTPTRMAGGFVLLFCLGLGLRLIPIFLSQQYSRAQSWNNFAVEDSALYLGRMQTMRENGIGSDAPEQWHYTRDRTPLYPIWLIGCDWLSKKIDVPYGAIVTMANVIFFCLSGAILFIILQRLIGYNVAFLASTIFLLEPSGITYSLAHLSDPLALLCLILSLFFFANGLRDKGLGLPLSGAFLAFGALARPVLLYFESILFAIVLVCHFGKSIFLRRGIWQLVTFLLVISPWCIRNKLVWDRLVFTPSLGSHLYYFYRPMVLKAAGNNSDSDARLPTDPKEFEKTFGVPFGNLAKRNDVLAGLAKADLRAHPFATLWTIIYYGINLYLGTGGKALASMMGKDFGIAEDGLRNLASIYLWVIGNFGWNWFQIISWAFIGLLYTFSFVGIIQAFKSGSSFLGSFLLISWLYFAAILGPITPTRYRMMLIPVFATFGAIGLKYIYFKLYGVPGRNEG